MPIRHSIDGDRALVRTVGTGEVTFAEVAALFTDQPELMREALKVVTPDFFRAVGLELGATEADAAAAGQAFAAAILEGLEAAGTRAPGTG